VTKESSSNWQSAGLQNRMLWVRIPPGLPGADWEEGTALTLERRMVGIKTPSFVTKVKNYFLDSWTELKKVDWPKRDQVEKFTGVVIVTVIAVAFFLYLWDRIISAVSGRLFRL
jgi:preprotein translocase SecE subunit